MFFPVGCGCPVKQSVLMSSSASFTRVQVGTVDFASRHLVLQHSDKRRVIADLKVYFLMYTCSLGLTFIGLVLMLSEQF
jgi:hypothetical protein